MRLVRVRLEATSPDRALASALAAFGQRTARVLSADMTLPPGASVEAVYRLERALLAPRVIVPIVHLPELSALAAHVEAGNAPAVLPSGAWDFASLWIRADKP